MPVVQSEQSDAERLRATQKNQDAVSVYFARRTSPYVTPLFLKLGISANQATAIWGLIVALVYAAWRPPAPLTREPPS